MQVLLLCGTLIIMTKRFYHADMLPNETAKRGADIVYLPILGKNRHVLRANTFKYKIDQFTGWARIEINWLYRMTQKATMLIIPILWEIETCAFHLTVKVQFRFTCRSKPICNRGFSQAAWQPTHACQPADSLLRSWVSTASRLRTLMLSWSRRD